MKLRVSFIDFLNAVPLGWGFLNGPYQEAFELLFDVPAECAKHLTTGEADVGLIPVIEYQNIPSLRVLPDISIASKREAKSVLFVSKLPLETVSDIAVDQSSRTSIALLKILIHHFYGRDSVKYSEKPPDAEKMLESHQAALIIGNPALKVRSHSLYVYDLAQEWNRFTGLPFVFAFWAVRSEVDLGDQLQLFYRSREQGLKEVDTIARRYSKQLGITASEIRSYIQKNLDYSLDSTNQRGLETFFQLAAQLELTPAPRRLNFYR